MNNWNIIVESAGPEAALATARARTQLAGSEASWAPCWPPAACSVPAVSSLLPPPVCSVTNFVMWRPGGAGDIYLAYQNINTRKHWDLRCCLEKWTIEILARCLAVVVAAYWLQDDHRDKPTDEPTPPLISQVRRDQFLVSSNEQHCSTFFIIFLIRSNEYFLSSSQMSFFWWSVWRLE